MFRAFSVFALLLSGIVPAAASDVRVLNANALTIALKRIADPESNGSGNTVSFTSGSPGVIQKKLDDGEAFDILIMPVDAIAALERAGKLVAGSRRPLAKVGIGIAIRDGAPKPDIATPDALRKALLAEKTVVMSDSATGGLSGRNAMEVLRKLGIADEIKGKLVQTQEGQPMIGRGEAGLGLYNVSEIPRAPGVILLGRAPVAVQVYIEYEAAVAAASPNQTAALAVLKAFGAPSSRPIWEAAGIDLAVP